MAAKYLPAGPGFLAYPGPHRFINAKASIEFARDLLQNGGPSADELDQFKLSYEDFSVEVATELGVVFGEVNVSNARRFVVYEYFRYKDVIGPDNAVIRWGSSARCVINLKKLEADVSLNGIANISMSSQVNKVENSVMIDGIGIKPGPLAQAVPKFNKLDMTTYVKLEHAFNEALPILMESNEFLQPTLLGIWGQSNDPILDKETYRTALAKGYALSEISKRVPLKKSSYYNSPEAESTFKDAVKVSYAEFIGHADVNKRPTKYMAEKAKKLLKGLELESED